MKKIGAVLGYGGLVLVLSTGLVWVLRDDFRPQPVYDRIDDQADVDPWCPIVGGRPLVIEVSLPGRSPSGVSFPLSLPKTGAELKVEARNPRDGATFDSQTVRGPGNTSVEFGHIPPGLDRLVIEFSSNTEAPEAAPRLAWSAKPPGYGAVVRLGGEQVPDRGPLLVLEYPWPTRMALLIWLGALVLFFPALRYERVMPAFFIVLGLACIATSVFLWQAHYTRHFGHWDADAYGRTATMMADYLTRPERRPNVAAFLHELPIFHNALASAIMALPIALGVPWDVAYLEFSTFCTFATLWLLYHIVRWRLGLSHATALIAVAALGCHVLILRTFSRPVTDAFGLLLVVCTLDLLLARLQAVSAWHIFGLAVLIALHPLARPQGLGYIPFIVAATILCDRLRMGTIGFGAIVKTTAQLVVVPVAILATLFLSLNWEHNFKETLKQAGWFRAASTTPLLFTCLAGLAQCLPLLWPLGWRQWRHAGFCILLLWGLFYLVMLVAVKAPFWLRHFAPLLPPAIAFTAAGLEDAVGRWRWPSRMVIVAFCLLNLAAAFWQICCWADIPEAVRPFISSG